MRQICRYFLFILYLFFFVPMTLVHSGVSVQEVAEQTENGDMFDFGTVETENLLSAEKPPPPGHPIYYVLPAIFFLLIFILILVMWIKAKNFPKWQPFFLSGLPPSFKLFITLLLSVYGLVHIAALVNVFIQTNIVYQSTAEYFFYMPIQKLTGTTHAHLFGHATMYAITVLAFMFTGVSERIKIPIVAAAFLGAPLDLYSWWLIKYLGGEYEILSAISGGSFSLAFLTMYVFVLFELWFRKKQDNSQN